MKILYLFSPKTKALTEHNLYKLDNLLEAYQLLIDLISEDDYTDKEIKDMFAATDDIIYLKNDECARIINFKKSQNSVDVANQDFKQLLLTKQ
jgi:hypothetical protein